MQDDVPEHRRHFQESTSDDKLMSARQRLESPRAAALAGVLFAVLYGSGLLLVRLAIPADPADPGVWLKTRPGTVSVGLSLVPLAGIAFLWFIGVVRERIGAFEDQLFTTVFLGGGLLFLAMTFVSTAIAGGVVAAYAVDHNRLIDSGAYTLARETGYRLTNGFAVKSAGVFMFSLGTIAYRTRIMPRSLAVFTLVLAAGLVLSIGSSPWVAMIFPSWVFVVSVYLLRLNLHRPTG